MKISRPLSIATSLCLVLLAQAGILVLGNRGLSMGDRESKLPNLFDAELIKLDDKEREINSRAIESTNKFSFKLFAEIIKNEKNKNENIFISPVSMATVLTILYNGANGETQQAIGKTLELQGLGLEELNIANAALRSNLENLDPQVKLSIANSFWGRKEEPFKPEFMAKINKFYNAEIENIDFSDPQSTSTINDWIKKSTNNTIDRIVDRFEPNTVFVVLNAIYFEGAWTQPFPKEATQERPFNLLNGTRKMHPMMSRTINYPTYYENEKIQAIRLPYGENRLAMYVFLPKSNVNWQSFCELLTAEKWNQWLNELKGANSQDNRPEKLLLRLPRFKLEYEVDLVAILKNLGMAIAFTPNADFSEMTASPLWISQAKQKTFIEVNEERTVAGAVSMAAGTRSPIEVNMIVDRPFFYAIGDDRTGTILFMGSVVDPQ